MPDILELLPCDIFFETAFVGFLFAVIEKNAVLNLQAVLEFY